MAEAQKNVPIDEPYHDQLKRIAIIDKTSMKNTVQKWIKKDGRGVVTTPKKSEKPESPQNADIETPPASAAYANVAEEVARHES
jgi:hypothetical protein